jgi:hypothetical protein
MDDLQPQYALMNNEEEMDVLDDELEDTTQHLSLESSTRLNRTEDGTTRGWNVGRVVRVAGGTGTGRRAC